ncbi:TonB-dependent receptor [Qipengyuania marisflavi]|uniref:TonB-dependent receptor n=1 Tax=Qipengyuania marisflavi TaxID=2486356 RepID=A0A5S3P662_9SPHN|nr:TonB-dependent receptor [Qipengyuania marisflavi]TMM48444.1 TonB-dependent receptor [Qipengyuania marisflavi]
MLYPALSLHGGLSASLSMLALVMAAPVAAQEAQPAPDKPATKAPVEDDPVEDDLHDRRVNPTGQIVVQGHGLKQMDLLAGTSVMEGSELQQNAASQIGDVLAGLPGVSATGFSPGASRPVLRGFSGERVRVLVDGLGSIDISNTSADHAVTIDPLTAERIEVLRGPAVMLYGSSAIGGAVNVIDKRIPRRVPAEAVHVDAMLLGDTASDLREAGASVDVPLGGGLVVHFDGSYHTSNDLEIAGYQVARVLRARLLRQADALVASGDAEAADELRTAALNRGTVPNSATETYTFNGGFALFRGDSNLGASVGVYDTAYGIPARPGGEEDVSIALHQLRADARSELDLGTGFLRRMTLRAGFSDYTHTEFEGAETGTVFDVQGIEGRLTFEQADRGGWRGSFGSQYYFRDFAATGEEAYIAPNRTNQFAVFALQEFGNGPVEVEAAARFETTRIDAVSIGYARSFEAFSGALGLSYETTGGIRFGVNVSRAERAPSAEELLPNGAHIATQAFEIGDLNLVTEKAWGAEAYARGRAGPITFSLAAFRSWFNDYIYQAATGGVEDGLPVFAYRQAGATYSGLEGEVSWAFLDRDPLSLVLDLQGDYIHAELDDGLPVPRIPPLSLTAGLEAQTAAFDARVEAEWTAKQDRVAPLETRTDGFTFVNALVTWRPVRGNDMVSVVLKADNIFDVSGRRHASFTKDFVPLAGRNFSASVRVSF